MKQLKMELKVCEGCGGLWVRDKRVDGVYCRHCDAVLAEFPVPLERRPPGRVTAKDYEVYPAAAGTGTGGEL